MFLCLIFLLYLFVVVFSALLLTYFVFCRYVVVCDPNQPPQKIDIGSRDPFAIERTSLPVRSTLVLAAPFGSASRPKNSLAEQLFGEKQRDIKFANSSGKLLFIYCCDPDLCFEPLQLRVDFFLERSRCMNAVLNYFSSLQVSFLY